MQLKLEKWMKKKRIDCFHVLWSQNVQMVPNFDFNTKVKFGEPKHLV